MLSSLKYCYFDNHRYYSYGIGFDARGSFSILNCCRFGKSVIIFGGDRSSSVHIDYNKKYILILGKDPSEVFNDTTLTE